MKVATWSQSELRSGGIELIVDESLRMNDLLCNCLNELDYEEPQKEQDDDTCYASSCCGFVLTLSSVPHQGVVLEDISTPDQSFHFLAEVFHLKI